MSKSLRVLIVEDSEDDVLILVRHLRQDGFSPVYEVVEKADDMKAALKKQLWDVIISDYSMPHFDGRAALEILKETGIDLPFLIVSGEIGEEVAVSAMRAGAHDYLMKNNLTRLGPAIERELQEAEVRRERRRAEEGLRESEARFAGILDIAQEAIISIDQSHLIIIFNKGAEEIFGYSLDEIIGKSINLLIPDKFLEVHHKHIGEFVGSPTNSRRMGERTEIFGRRKSGEEFPAEASISKLELSDNIILTVILRDMTARKRMEQTLRTTLSEIKQLKNQLQAENIYLQEEIKLEHNFEEIICQDDSFKKVLSKVEQVAATDATVLILGETGTGKELIARALHVTSLRKERPLVKINCAALPTNLIESEIFGHEKGAFTGALSRKQGRFELADKGTLFLDEIGDMPLDLQAKVLRVLQEGEFERVGGTQTLKVDVRVIAATNRNLEKAIEKGQFREDLYYRLNVFPIKLPPLRERQQDIELLVHHFIKKYGKKLGKELKTIPRKVMNMLQSYNFPGNIRELENIIERAIITAKGETLQLDDSLEIVSGSRAAAVSGSTLADMERSHILSILEETGWRIQGRLGAAARLGLNSGTLRSRMKKLGIERPQPTI